MTFDLSKIKEKVWVQGVRDGELVYLITSNKDRSLYFLCTPEGKHLHKANNPLKFTKDVKRIFGIGG